ATNALRRQCRSFGAQGGHAALVRQGGSRPVPAFTAATAQGYGSRDRRSCADGNRLGKGRATYATTATHALNKYPTRAVTLGRHCLPVSDSHVVRLATSTALAAQRNRRGSRDFFGGYRD